jgi:glycosyltransferase involved in cell wall biosynthesis
MLDFEVLMAVCATDDPHKLSTAFSGIVNQTVQPKSLILVADGPLSREIDTVISEYSPLLPFQFIRLKHNSGLCAALNTGLSVSSESVIIRHDADDFSLPHRFQTLVTFLGANPQIDVLGSQVEEIYPDSSRRISRYPASHQDIARASFLRNPLAHPSVAFRRDSVINAGSYPLMPKAQDYALWLHMIKSGYKMANLDETLVIIDADPQFIRRRGLSYFKHEVTMLNYLLSRSTISSFHYFILLLSRFTIRVLPASVRTVFYKLRP